MRSALATTTLGSFLLLACGGPEVRHPYKADEGTPANSTSEARLAGADPNQPKATVKSASASDDPTAPQVNKVSDMPKGSAPEESGRTSGSNGKKTSSGAAERPGKASGSGPRVSAAECDQVLEKALELEIGSKPEFAGIDKKQLIAQTKTMARQQHGEAPCEATRSQYNCAMSAGSTAEWKRCMQ